MDIKMTDTFHYVTASLSEHPLRNNSTEPHPLFKFTSLSKAKIVAQTLIKATAHEYNGFVVYENDGDKFTWICGKHNHPYIKIGVSSKTSPTDDVPLNPPYEIWAKDIDVFDEE